MLCCPHFSMLSTILSSIVTPDCGLIQAQKCWTILLTTLNNVGSTTLFTAVFINLCVFCCVLYYRKRPIGLFFHALSNRTIKRFYCQYPLKRGDRRVRIFSAHNNWWATPEVGLLLPYQCSAKVFLIVLRQGVKTMYYFKKMLSKLLKCAK